MTCRHCGCALKTIFVDLGFAPPSNAYLSQSSLDEPEKYFPLKVWVCEECWLVQTEDHTTASELFNSSYAYFSSTSKSWLEHAERYVDKVIRELNLDSQSLVIEIASNDGYLLRNFGEAGIPCLGIEPTNATADAAEKLGIPVIREFFGEALGNQLANEGRQADLLIGNNVYAHVPDINDFTKGLQALLKPGGTITLEFPHFMRLVQHCQFDTIYHEHFSYLSLQTVCRIFTTFGLRVYNIEELDTHGGSLRVFGCHQDDRRADKKTVKDILLAEEARGLKSQKSYLGFQHQVDRIVFDLLAFLIKQKQDGKKVVAYGAAAKGNTLLNYAGIRPNLIEFVSDASPAKQGRFMPGSHIPIKSPDALISESPDYILILPWNISREIIKELRTYCPDSIFLTAVPGLSFLE